MQKLKYKLFTSINNNKEKEKEKENTDDNILFLSKELITNLKTQIDYTNSKRKLEEIDINILKNTLDSDEKKKTFWINIYNSYTIINLKDESQKKIYPRLKFFDQKNIKIAKEIFSLSQIENKFLRRSKILFCLGYMSYPNCFVSSLEKSLRVNKLDSRIHFALNCGAKSCPPVLFYNENNIDRSLLKAEKSFISSSEFDEKTKILKVSRIFFWYKGDFGGTKGVINLHMQHGIVPGVFKVSDVNLKYQDYNWEIITENRE